MAERKSHVSGDEVVRAIVVGAVAGIAIEGTITAKIPPGEAARIIGSVIPLAIVGGYQAYAKDKGIDKEK